MERQLSLDLMDNDASSQPDAPVITPDLIEASNCLDHVFRCWQKNQHRDAHIYALKLRQAADDLARELQKFAF